MDTRFLPYWFLFSLMIWIAIPSFALGQPGLEKERELIPPSSDPLSFSSPLLLPGELIPPSRDNPQSEVLPKDQPQIIHRTFTVHEEVIRKNKELNQSFCVPEDYVVFQYSHILLKRSRYAKFRIIQDPHHQACIQLIATLESSSKKLFGFFLKRPTATLHLKIHVSAKLPLPVSSQRSQATHPSQQLELPDSPPSSPSPLNHNRGVFSPD